MIPWNIFYISIGMGIFFFVFIYLRFYQKIHINESLIAGFSLTYIFLDILPEILLEFPEFPEFHLFFESPPFLIVIIGFATQHLIEKIILQKVDTNTQLQARKLIEIENDLEKSEHNYEIALTEEVVKKNVDGDIVRNYAEKILLLLDQEKSTKTQIHDMKQKITRDLSKDLRNLRFHCDFIYEFTLGIILIEILKHDIISGLFFFVFTFLHAIVANKKHHEKAFTDLDIEIELSDSKLQRILTSFSILFGILVGIILNTVFEIDLEIIFMLLSFITGMIFHEIMHHMPEKEKGNSSYFITGMIIFFIIYFISRLIH